MAVLCCAGGAAVRGQRQRSHESQRFHSGRGPCALRLRHRAALAATYSTHAPSRAVTSSLLGSAGKTVRRFALRPVTVAVATQGTQGLLVGSQNLDRHALTACGLEHTSFQRVHHDEESLKTACAGPCLPTCLRKLSSDTALSESYLVSMSWPTGMLSSPAVTGPSMGLPGPASPRPRPS